MRLIHFAFAITVILLGITGYLAWEGQQEAKGARAEVEFIRKQRADMGVDDTGRQLALEKATLPLEEPPPASAPAEAPKAADPGPPIAATEMAGTNVLGVSAETEEDRPVIPGGRKTPATVDIPLLTSQQKKVMESDVVARIKVVKLDQGFVVIDAGIEKGIKAGDTYDVRRDSALVGRVKLSEIIEATESVADVLPGSTPPGVKIEEGDELVVPLKK